MKANIEKFKERKSKALEEPSALSYEGQLKFRQGNVQEAKAKFEKAIKKNSHYIKAYLGLANVLYAQRFKNEAVQVLEQGINKNPDDAFLKGRLGLILEEQGKLKEAAKKVVEAIKLEQQPRHKKQWIRILQRIKRNLGHLPPTSSAWSIARRDIARSSHVSIGHNLRISLEKSWSYSFETPIRIRKTYNIPSPIIAGDFLIIPDPNMERLLALSLSDGKKQWQTERIATNLTYASSPVLASSCIIFATLGSIKQIDLNAESPTPHDTWVDKRIKMAEVLSTPLAYKEWIIFPFEDNVLVYDSQIEFGYFIDAQGVELPRSAVVFEDKVMILSKYGQVFHLKPSLILQEIERKDLLAKAICSAPCVSGNLIYFEVFQKRKRKICTYNIVDGNLTVGDISGESCAKDHLHFNFPPLAYNNGVIVTSDISSKLYYARCVGDNMDIMPIDIDISVGPKKVVTADHIFSVIIGTYFISKTEDGFFYINLEDMSDKGMEFFGSEVVAQPIADQNRIFFLCRNGVRCYTLNY